MKKKRIILLHCLASIVLFTSYGFCKKDVLNSDKKINDEYMIIPPTNMDTIPPININTIKKYIALQANTYTEADVIVDDTYFPSKYDIELTCPLIQSSLRKSGYKFPDDSTFRDRIQRVFSWDVNSVDTTNLVIIRGLEGLVGAGEEVQYCPFPLGEIFADKERNIIMPFIYLDDLITFDETNGNQYQINQIKWLYHLNQYVMYGSGASRTYLIQNEPELIGSLLIKYGYDEDDRLNSFVIYDYNKLNLPSIKLNKLIFYRDPDTRELQVRKGILKFIISHTSKDNNDLVQKLEEFGYGVGDRYYDNYSEDERLMIVAYIADTILPLYFKYSDIAGKADWNPGTMLYNLTVREPDLLEKIKNKNYFGLEGLKEVVRRTESQLIH